jgi:hypothetical protein
MMRLSLLMAALAFFGAQAVAVPSQQQQPLAGHAPDLNQDETDLWDQWSRLEEHDGTTVRTQQQQPVIRPNPNLNNDETEMWDQWSRLEQGNGTTVHATSAKDPSRPMGGCGGFLLTSDQMKNDLMNWPLAPIIFLKTHKTGSSTLTNIFYRMADWRGLKCMLPKRATGVDGQYLNYPDPFPGIREDAPHHQYDMIAAHAVFAPEMFNWMKSNPKVITIMREPTERWLSHWDYMISFVHTQSGGNCGADSNMLTQLLQTQQQDSGCNALKQGGSYQGVCSDIMRLCANQMAFDLGYFSINGNNPPPMLDSYVTEMDKRIDLVMITEMFDESLVLLKKLLGVPIEEVYAGHFKENSGARTKPTPEQVGMIRSVTSVDRRLYDHFHKKLEGQWIRADRRDLLMKRLKEQADTLDLACINEEKVCSRALRTDVAGYHFHLRTRGNQPCVNTQDYALPGTNDIRAD